MKITAKHGNGTKIHVSVDDEYLLTVDEDFWFSCGLVSGDEIDEEELAAFKKAAGSHVAFSSAMYSLDLRDHSEREMRIKLSRKYDAESVDTAVSRLVELGLINDARYAENLARSLFEYKKYGKNRIRNELFAKGIDSGIVSDTLDVLFENAGESAPERIAGIIRKKYYGRMSDENSRKKVFSALVRLGYGYSDIREAMSEFCDDEFYED